MEPLYSPPELAEIAAYHGPRYVHAAVDALLWPLVMGLIVAFGTGPLHRVSTAWAARAGGRFVAALDRAWGDRSWLSTALFANLLYLGFALVDLPVTVYFGYFREHAYGLSTTSPAVFALDWLKGVAAMTSAVTALALGMFGVARKLRHWWWIVGLVAALGMLGSAALDPYRSRVYVDQAPLAEGTLRTRITALMAKAGIDFRDVLVETISTRTVRLQAYFAGQGPTRTIVLADTLVSTLSEDEVLAAVAHEAGHVHESRWVGRVGSSLALLAFLGLVEWLFRRGAARRWFGVEARADVRLLPLIILVFDLSADLAGPVSGAVSRQRESEADRYAVQLTQDPAAFQSMLRKAARVNKMDPAPPRWYVLKGMTHPPIGERLAAIGTFLPTRTP